MPIQILFSHFEATLSTPLAKRVKQKANCWYHNFLVLPCCAIFNENKLRGFWQIFPSNLYHKYLFSLAIHNYISGITDDNSHLTTQNSHPKRPPIDITIDFDYWVVGLKLWSSIHACTKTCLRGGPYLRLKSSSSVNNSFQSWKLDTCGMLGGRFC